MINEHTANDQKTTAWAASAGITAQTNDISMELKKESYGLIMKLNKELKEIYHLILYLSKVTF